MTDNLADVIREACRPWVFSTRGDIGAGDVEVNGGPDRGDSAETWEFYDALAAAVRAHYAALGGVTDEQIVEVIFDAIRAGGPGGKGTPKHNVTAMVPPIRDLIARAVAHAVASIPIPGPSDFDTEPVGGSPIHVLAELAEAKSRIAQLEDIQRDNEVRLDERVRMVERAEALTGRWHDRAEAAEAEVRRLNLRLSEATGEVMEAEAENAALRATVERVRALCDKNDADVELAWAYDRVDVPRVVTVSDLRAALDGEP